MKIIAFTIFRILPAILIFALSACEKAETPLTPKESLTKIVREAKPGMVGKIISMRTEPTTTPSHTADIEATKDGEVSRFSVFCKNGTWYYDEPISLISQGTPITKIDITTYVSIAAYDFDFRR